MYASALCFANFFWSSGGLLHVSSCSVSGLSRSLIRYSPYIPRCLLVLDSSYVLGYDEFVIRYVETRARCIDYVGCGSQSCRCCSRPSSGHRRTAAAFKCRSSRGGGSSRCRCFRCRGCVACWVERGRSGGSVGCRSLATSARRSSAAGACVWRLRWFVPSRFAGLHLLVFALLATAVVACVIGYSSQCTALDNRARTSIGRALSYCVGMKKMFFHVGCTRKGNCRDDRTSGKTEFDVCKRFVLY